MSTRARFYVQSFTLQAGDTSTVRLSAVCRGKENAEWSKFTPSGSLEMALTRQAGGAADFFRANVGRDVYVDITLVDPDLDVCTQCGEVILAPGNYSDASQVGTNVHGGNDVGYIAGEYVHQGCVTAVKERLGIS
jgi:hypothetical protein